ncbi:MAG: glycosyltransferase family 4 protein [Pyrinomonadaceae bacterium]
MNTYLSLFVIALLSSLISTPLIRRLAQRRGWLDVHKDRRRLHSKPIPRLGGVAIYLSVMISLGPLPFLDNLLTESLRPSGHRLMGILISATLVFLFGLYDDFRGSGAIWKLFILGLAAGVLYWWGIGINGISIPFVGSIALPPVLGFVLTILWVAGVSNAYNLIDGMDGLAAGAGLFATLVMLIVSFAQGNIAVAVLTLTLSGALIGFLRYNFNPASIFLGDSGALLIGFLLATLSMVGAQKASTAVAVAIPVMAFGLPIVDTSFTMVRRFISGRPIFQGDREHIHHKLLERGWSQRHVAFVLYAVCALFSLLALLTVSGGGGGRITAVTLIVMASAVIFLAGRLRYAEMDEIKAGIRRTVGDRRVRVANNVRIRRACRMMAEAETLAGVFEASQELLKSAEFAYATIELSCGNAQDNQRVFDQEMEAASLPGATTRDGVIWWEWERGDVEGHEILESHLFWNIRLPLSTNTDEKGVISLYREFGNDELLLDINYLTNLFQSELTRAAERIFSKRSVWDLNTDVSSEKRVRAAAAGA